MQLGKCSKTQNARGAREIAFAAFFFFFYLTTHLLNASLKGKTDNISIIIRRVTTAERARAVGMLQQYVSITLPVCIGHRSLNADVQNAGRLENDEFSLVYRKLRHFQQETGICKHVWEKRLTCRIPAPYRTIPMALAPFLVVICHMMVQNGVCFSFQ